MTMAELLLLPDYVPIHINSVVSMVVYRSRSPNVDEHTSDFPTIFIKDENFWDFLIAFLDNKTFPNTGLLLKETSCKFIPFH